jgi:hypothetical protein
VDETDPGSYPMADLGIRGAEPSASAITKLDRLLDCRAGWRNEVTPDDTHRRALVLALLNL